MKVAIAVITYRRLHALKSMLAGLEQHCTDHRIAVFEDCGQKDGTEAWLKHGRIGVSVDDIDATQYLEDPGSDAQRNAPFAEVFLGNTNLGVAKNSNRAIKWFMETTNCDVLCLCNDDLVIKGDFAAFYGEAHEKLGIGHFCYCPFTPDNYPNGETYRWSTVPYRGYKVKILPRFTGIMMSFTRDILCKIGYFNPSFTQFGNEHCDMTIRARLAGGVQVSGQVVNCLDVEHDLLYFQNIPSSVLGLDRLKADKEAVEVMKGCTASYSTKPVYQPFSLCSTSKAGGHSGAGTSTDLLSECGYAKCF